MDNDIEIYTKEEQTAYYFHKLTLALIFDNNYELYKKLSFIGSIDYLELLKSIVFSLTEREIVNDHVKNNILNVIEYVRYIDDEDSLTRKNIINQIICNVNSSNDNNSMLFYFDQFNYRTGKIVRYREKLERYIPHIEHSIFTDFLIINTHFDDITDEDFVNTFLPGFVDNNLYYESINVILKECPSMFKDKTFIDRVNSVIEINKLNKKYKKENKLLSKKLKLL